MADSFNTRRSLEVNGKFYDYYNIKDLADKFPVVKRLPFTHKILLENLLRTEDGKAVTKTDIEALLHWDASAEPNTEIAFTPSRVLLQDFTGVPAVVDLAAMRDAVVSLGGKPEQINPLSPAELVIDHSIQVDHYGKPEALDLNTRIEFTRNKERYAFLRWGQNSFSNFEVVPPETGIVHQVNLEYLARTVFSTEKDGKLIAYPDTVVGTDSHTTMINGLGILGWGVGGIEAEAAMLGQPISMLIPQVIGFELIGTLKEGTSATDLVLRVTEMLREKGVVGKFVEFFGDGVGELPLADRATLSNMSPEFGSTCGIFPIDGETIKYLELTGRSEDEIALVESYAKAQGLWRHDGQEPAIYSDTLTLDLNDVEPSIAGPKRPQDRINVSSADSTYRKLFGEMTDGRAAKSIAVDTERGSFVLDDGAIVIAAITSCTNTSNPAVMVAAGLLAKNANKKGLSSKPWVKTSLAPGSLVVTDYLEKANLMSDFEALNFHTVGYGCTTCIGNSGPLDPAIRKAVAENDLVVCSVLSGNRNFEGRISPDTKMNFLASPPLVVAYALAGNMNINLFNDPLGQDQNGKDVYLKDIWPSQADVHAVIAASLDSNMFKQSYANVYTGDTRWQNLEVPEGQLYDWPDSTYVKNPPYFVGMSKDVADVDDISGARCLALLGDTITTDHISPAGKIEAKTPAGQYLINNGVEEKDFNSYGSRRGNHEVMMRGTFANIRLRNQLAPGTEGGWTTYQPSGEQMYIYDASVKYKAEGTPLVVIAGKEYGTGSSRDWAAKGTLLLGVKAVLAESFERIHRSNLIGMGVLPLQFKDGENAQTHGLDGKETYAISGLANGESSEATVTATAEDGSSKSFSVNVRLDTPMERDYLRNGGILHYVLRQMAA
ncbi:MAG: aconitate hydratase AcnA [Gammaproteobacteria bacterium]|nr:aconitate hydratase AcnA [Gammaproteobacteria bacterium]NNM14443.1 aconitate hydratase AcnA [Gammaproteobacteria bacterium]